MDNTVFKLHEKDARLLDKYIKNRIITTTITSPPYYNMKDYGSEHQIGFGQGYQEYLNDLKDVFQKIYDVTKENGTLWIIIDTFKENNKVIPLPFDLTAKLNDVGWLLQDIIIWKKDKTVPWSGNGFVQRKFEYILFFSKNKNFKYYLDRVRVYDTNYLKKWWVKYPERYNPKGKALDEVWEYAIPTQGSWGQKYIRHFCPLPTDMIGNMIQLSTDEGDVVLDPFAGSGSVLSQASYMKRQYIGFELSQEYIEMFNKYLSKTWQDGNKKYQQFNSHNSTQNNFSNLILNLRSLKYARVLLKKLISKKTNIDIKYILVDIIGESNKKYKLIRVKYTIFLEKDSASFDTLELEIKSITSVAPLSKFGIEAVFEYKVDQSPSECSKNYYGYTITNTHSTFGEVTLENIPPKVKVLSKIKMDLNESDFE